MKNECVTVFNSMCRGEPLDINRVIKLISLYLTENNIENSEKMVNFIVNNPFTIKIALPKVVDYFCVKYTIFSIIFNNKTILYYVTN